MKRDDRDGVANAARLFEGLVTRDELAAHLGLSPDTLKRWAASGDGPTSIRVGRRVFYRATAVKDWLRSLERPRGPQVAPWKGPGK